MQTLSDVIRPALDTLRGNGISRNKKEATILGIIELGLMGEGYDKPEFWGRGDTAARSTYMKWRQDDPRFVNCLEECRKIAREWRSQLTTDSVEDALVILQLKSPEAARKIADLVTDENPRVALDAATRLLDRASVQTGKKATQTIAWPGLDEQLEKVYGDDEEE
jgi:hypothetical protein